MGSGWGAYSLIGVDDDVGYALNPQIALDTKGNALVVWQQSDGTRFNIMANRYVSGSGWGVAEVIETNNAGNAIDPQIAVDVDGNALVVWQQSDGSARTDIWANRYVVGSGWDKAALIETDDTGYAGSPQIAVDSKGNALAVWEQAFMLGIDIVANRYIKGIGWGTAVLIETNNAGNANKPQVAFDASDNAIAVWQQSDSKVSNIWSNRFQ
jgi:hypothetical protein